MALDLKRVLASKPRAHEQEAFARLTTPWADALDPTHVLQEHPRPQAARDGVVLLHGWWSYCIQADDRPLEDVCATDAPASFEGSILVPFSPEAELSGVQRQLMPAEKLWYRLPLTMDGVGEATVLTALGRRFVLGSKRCLLHFDGVDHSCALWINGQLQTRHKGGYMPFACDITDALHHGVNEILLCVEDPSDTGLQLRGKQKLQRGDIWYTAQSGIWQPVWLEAAPADRIEDFRIVASADGALDVTVVARGQVGGVQIVLADGKDVAARFDAQEQTSTYRLDGEVKTTTFRLCTQIHDVRTWSPDDPHLYTLAIETAADSVRSYCGFRSVEVRADDTGVKRFFLNGEPLFLKGVLDQGYWPDGLLTPPADEAMAFDIQAMKDAGFNMLRKHIKVENPRWYWHADRLGMLVWQDMVSGGTEYSTWNTSYLPTLFKGSWTRFRDDTPAQWKKLSAGDALMRQEWMDTCKATVTGLANHPCVVTWVLFNEGWGQFGAADAVRAVRELDGTRPIDATSGWYDQGAGDYWSVHNYFRDMEVWPDTNAPEPRAFVISELGGLTQAVEGHTVLPRSYGYDSAGSPQEWRESVAALLAQLKALEPQGLAGYVYTQLSDVEEETNGLVTFDRRVNKLAEDEGHDGR